MKELRKLVVGDRLCNKIAVRFGKGTFYTFATVERLTKAQAVLSNGVKLVNEPHIGRFGNDVEYSTYGDSWNKWTFETEELIEEARKEEERQQINNWFASRTFSEEEKAIIYNTFKELNIL